MSAQSEKNPVVKIPPIISTRDRMSEMVNADSTYADQMARTAVMKQFELLLYPPPYSGAFLRIPYFNVEVLLEYGLEEKDAQVLSDLVMEELRVKTVRKRKDRIKFQDIAIQCYKPELIFSITQANTLLADYKDCPVTFNYTVGTRLNSVKLDEKEFLRRVAELPLIFCYYSKECPSLEEVLKSWNKDAELTFQRRCLAFMLKEARASFYQINRENEEDTRQGIVRDRSRSVSNENGEKTFLQFKGRGKKQKKGKREPTINRDPIKRREETPSRQKEEQKEQRKPQSQTQQKPQYNKGAIPATVKNLEGNPRPQINGKNNQRNNTDEQFYTKWQRKEKPVEEGYSLSQSEMNEAVAQWMKTTGKKMKVDKDDQQYTTRSQKGTD
jgi:hypothetical protein